MTDPSLQYSSGQDETKAYQQALRYLKFRMRSRAEIRKYLKEKKFPVKAVESTIHQLTLIGLLDDHQFARLWVENRRRFRPRGIYALKMELKAKGIADDIVSSVLKYEDEEKNAYAAIASRIPRWSHLGKEELTKKIFNFLRSRGFSFEICTEVKDRFIKE